MQTWKDAQEWELNWHKNYNASYKEPIKQEVYADKMGLTLEYPDHDLKGQKILDIGSGDTSMLLKYKNFTATALDPLMDRFPKWVRTRYEENNIKPLALEGERLDLTGYDEVMAYNVLQHTKDPAKIARNALKAGKIIRWFDWIEIGTSDGHLHNLTEKKLNKWFNGKGKVHELNEKGCYGLAWTIIKYGV